MPHCTEDHRKQSMRQRVTSVKQFFGMLMGGGLAIMIPVGLLILGGIVQWIMGIVVAVRNPAKHVAEVIAAIFFGPIYMVVRGFMGSACAFKKGGCPPRIV